MSSIKELYGEEGGRKKGNNVRNVRKFYGKKIQDETKIEHEWKEKMTMNPTKWKLHKSVLILIFIVLSATCAHGMENEDKNHINRLIQQVLSKHHIWKNIMLMLGDYEDLFNLYHTCKKFKNTELEKDVALPLLCPKNSQVDFGKLLWNYHSLFQKLQNFNANDVETIFMTTPVKFKQEMHIILKNNQKMLETMIIGAGWKYYNNSYYETLNDVMLYSNQNTQVFQNETAWVFKSNGSMITSDSYYHFRYNKRYFSLDGVAYIQQCKYGFMAIRKTFTNLSIVYWTYAMYKYDDLTDETFVTIPILENENIKAIKTYKDGRGFLITLDSERRIRIEVNLKEKAEEDLKELKRWEDKKMDEKKKN